jgi:hypothetical protein
VSWRLSSTAAKAQCSASKWRSTRIGPRALRIYADEYGVSEHVARFVLRCAEAFDLKGPWGACWSLTCAAHRSVRAGGGLVLDLAKHRTVASIDCADWLADYMAATSELAEHRQREVT